MAPRAGFEPATIRLTVERSTTELPGSSLSARRAYSRRFSGSARRLDRELLHGDALVERVLGVEQQGQHVASVDPDLDGGDIANLDLVRDRGDRALLRVEHPERDSQLVGDQRAAPAPRPERADR